MEGVEVDNEMSSDLRDIVSEESPSVEALPEDSTVTGSSVKEENN